MDDMSLSANKFLSNIEIGFETTFPLISGVLLYNNSSPVYEQNRFQSS